MFLTFENVPKIDFRRHLPNINQIKRIARCPRKLGSVATHFAIACIECGVCHLSTPQLTPRLQRSTLYRRNNDKCRYAIGRTSLLTTVYANLLPPGVAAHRVATTTGGLLHRLLTLTLAEFLISESSTNIVFVNTFAFTCMQFLLYSTSDSATKTPAMAVIFFQHALLLPTASIFRNGASYAAQTLPLDCHFSIFTLQCFSSDRPRHHAILKCKVTKNSFYPQTKGLKSSQEQVFFIVLGCILAHKTKTEIAYFSLIKYSNIQNSLNFPSKIPIIYI